MTSGKRFLLFLAPLLTAALVVLGAWAWLGTYTRHNQQVQVPDVKAMSFEEATQALEALGLKPEVVDSVYSDEAAKGAVVEQDPRAGKYVKPERTVYLVMNASQPKMLNMPDLVSLSKRQAMSVMEILGLKVEKVEYRPDPCFDCVVAQLYKGQPIPPDGRIRKGEAITLVLGQGQKGEQIPVPDLRGMGFQEMKEVLALSSLKLGLVVEVKGCGNNGCDTALATVVRQFPAAGPEDWISPGGMVDVWLTLEQTPEEP
ncbi:MAG TPA: PASTA domain-containing protein [Flavobacteriales bacterium]|nr:PASTA domain-containing protein [Flavobacteriales bacterium]